MPTKILELNERQKLFFKARSGLSPTAGRAAAAKTWAVRIKAMLLACRYAGIKILIIRRSFTELRETTYCRCRWSCGT